MSGKYSAPSEIRQNLGCLLWITGTGGLGAILTALPDLPSMPAWIQIVVGIDLLVVTFGIWYAKEWARWAGGIIASIYFIWGLVNLIRDLVATGDLSRLLALPVLGLMGLLAWYSFQASTRKRFAEARELIARR